MPRQESAALPAPCSGAAAVKHPQSRVDGATSWQAAGGTALLRAGQRDPALWQHKQQKSAPTVAQDLLGHRPSYEWAHPMFSSFHLQHRGAHLQHRGAHTVSQDRPVTDQAITGLTSCPQVQLLTSCSQSRWPWH